MQIIHFYINLTHSVGWVIARVFPHTASFTAFTAANAARILADGLTTR